MSDVAAALDHVREMILADIEQSRGAGRETLRVFVRIGTRLAEAKAMIGSKPKGAFGAWCEQHFPLSKEWRARLLRLAAQWPTIERVMEALKAKGRVLGRKEFSVDGALALVAAFIREYPEEAEAMGLGAEVAAARQRAEQAEQRRAERQAEEDEKTAEAERLRAALAAALERIRALEAEIVRLRPKDKAEDGGAPGVQVDKATAARARKVAAMVELPGQPGEALAAWERLGEMARKVGADLAAFLTACGLNADALGAARARAEAEGSAKAEEGQRGVA